MEIRGFKKNTKSLLIEKAIDLFYEKGYTRTSVRDLVKETGVTNSSLYNYFRNKEDLLHAIIKRIGDDLLNGLSDEEKKYSNPLDILKSMAYFQMSHFIKRKKEIKIFVDELYQLSPESKREILEQHRSVYEFYKRQICDLEKLGLLRSGNKSIMSFSCLSLMNWFYRWYREDGKLSCEQICDQIMDIFLKGILNDQGRG